MRIFKILAALMVAVCVFVYHFMTKTTIAVLILLALLT